MQGDKEIGKFIETGNAEADAQAAYEIFKASGLHKKLSKAEIIFGQANAFAHTALEIYKQHFSTEPPTFRAIAPYVVNATLAIELFIKTLHGVQGNYPTGHKLVNLALGLQPKTRAILDKYAEALKAKYKIPEDRNLISCLESIGNAFVEWRYVYEQEKLLID